MSEHPFQRMFRNLAALIVALPVQDASTRPGRAAARLSLRLMYPPDARRLRWDLSGLDEAFRVEGS